MKTAVILLSTGFMLGVATGANIGKKLPPGVTPCSLSVPNLEECNLARAKEAIPIFAKGIPSYRLLPLDPLHLPRIIVDDTSGDRRVNIAITMKDVDMIGLAKTQMKHMDMTPNSTRVLWQGRVPLLSLIGDYEVSGRVLILPITGTGPMNITLENVDWTYTFDWRDAKVKDGRQYIDISNNKLDFKTSRCYIYLENLFNGDKRLSDNMNVFLNENWQALTEDLGPPIAEALNLAFLNLMKTLAEQVPHDEFSTP